MDVFTFDGALPVLGHDRVAREDVVELVTAAAEDTGAIYPGGRAKMTARGDLAVNLRIYYYDIGELESKITET